MALRAVDQEENRRRMRNGQLYFAFTPDLVADRKRCRQAFEQFNSSGDVGRRAMVELFQNIVDDRTPLPSQGATEEEDEDLLADYVWCERPVKMDYGYNVKMCTSTETPRGSTPVSSPLAIAHLWAPTALSSREAIQRTLGCATVRTAPRMVSPSPSARTVGSVGTSSSLRGSQSVVDAL
ncbi:hypothetical protein F5Y14DRAFT_97445 [Nemania sp. NC0429]|nr:hypothetical protein F5Y14DRAFT_97445 [Nemania sp. NC0429]